MATARGGHASGLNDEPIIMGRLAGPYGTRGWVRVVSYTEVPHNLAEYTPWYLRQGDRWVPTEVVEVQHHTKGLLVRIADCEDRNKAAELAGVEIGVYRGQLPAAAADEYYWDELIGMRVVTVEGHLLGTVDHLIETGANDVLVVVGERERLIPFIRESVIRQIDRDERTIRVDWDPEF